MEFIGTIYSDLPEKFGIPRQSGAVKELIGKIIFNPPYNAKEAFDGIEEFSHIWVLWQFSESTGKPFSPTVRPPRLGGNKKKGVFATRSPFRPNSIGLSCVELLSVEHTKAHGTVLTVGGIDMKSGTPIVDIKPYIPYADCIKDASSGFAKAGTDCKLQAVFPDEILNIIPKSKRSALVGILEQDPRPAYQNDSSRIYGVSFAGYNVKFKVDGSVLTVISAEKQN